MTVSIAVELNGIKLDAIFDARATISGALDDPKVKQLLSGNGFEAALGSLGSAIASLKATGDASSLLKPLGDAASSIAGTIDPGAFPVADYAGAVSEGAKIVAQFLKTLQFTPENLGRLLPFDQLTQSVEAVTSGYTIAGDGIGRFRELVNRVEGVLPVNPPELARLTVDVLLPFGGAGVTSLRGGIDGLFSATAAIKLPRGRTEGLVLALAAVEAASHDPVKLSAALTHLERVRVSTLGVLRTDLDGIRNAIARLRVAEALQPLLDVAATIRSGDHGFLELLDELRAMLVRGRLQVETFDVQEIRKFVERLVVLAEEQVRVRIEKPIDDSVRLAEEFVRGLFRHLPLREYRAQVTEFLAEIAGKIEGANLDAAAEKIHKALADVAEAIDPAKLTQEVQNLLGDVKTAIEGVVAKIKGALAQVVNAIKAIEQKLKDVFQRVVEVLGGFAEAMKSLTAAVESLGVEDATDQVIAAIRELRAKAEELLSSVELPEPLRPVVQQAISQLESIDLDGLFEPVTSVVAQIKIPAQVKAQITGVLADVQAKLQNAVPAELIASINAEVGKVIQTIRNFDPAKLLAGVKQYIEDAAKLVESLDPTKIAEQIRGPFQALLDLVDQLSPRVLLAPVIEAYDSLLSGIAPQSETEAGGAFAGVVSQAGESATSKMVEPVGQVGGVKPNVPQSDGAPPEPKASPLPADLKVKPGDAVRFLGHLPNKLREGIAALPKSTAGEVVARIDSVTGALARDLRLVRERVLALAVRIEDALEADLNVVGDAQMSAQLALHASPAPGVDVDLSVSAVASVSPAALRAELEQTLGELRGSVTGQADAVAGEVGVVLEQAAMALESFRIGGVTGSLDELLAALDPEPVAAELDALAAAALKRAPEVIALFDDSLLAAFAKLNQLFRELNPAAQAQKFLGVVTIVAEELDVLNPSRLADELAGIHQAVREAITAYDPLVFAADLKVVVQQIAGSLRALDVTAIFGNVDFLGPVVATVEEANPAKVLESVGTSLAEVSAQLAELNPAALLEAVDTIGVRIEQEFQKAIDAIRDELVALLESLQYAAGGASASVSVSGSVNV